MIKGVVYSTLLHGFLVLFMWMGIPEFLAPKRDYQPTAITVEILPIKSISNVKLPQAKKTEKLKLQPKSKPKPPKPPKKAEVKNKKVNAATRKDDKAAKLKDAEKLKFNEKKNKRQTPKENKKAEEEQNAFDAILKSVRQAASDEREESDDDEQEQASEPNNNRSTFYNDAIPLSLSEIDAIRNQIQRCWRVPAGAKDAHSLIVNLRVQLRKDGSLILVEIASRDLVRYNTEPFFQAAVDSAIRAVRECSPIKNLPQEKYNTWRDMELSFDPHELLY